MRIALGATALANGIVNNRLDGIAYYTQEILQVLRNKYHTGIPIVYSNAGVANLERAAVKQYPPYPLLCAASALSGLSFPGNSELASIADLFHSPDHHVPRLRGIPVVATLMDAVPLSHPQWTNQSLRTLKNHLWKRSTGWAQHIITISEYSRQEIVRHFGIPESRITAIPLGVDDRFYERLDTATMAAINEKFSLPERFFVFIGTLQPRKNVERIIQAHEQLPARLQKEVPLLIVGRNGAGTEQLAKRLQDSGPSDKIRWLRNVNDTEKRAILQSATAMVFPSLCEGFGLPVLEGFASQIPVITSNTTSLPEVSGGAAIEINPTDTRALAEAMAEVATNTALCASLITKGLEQARQFSWDGCVQQTVDIYRQVLGRH